MSAFATTAEMAVIWRAMTAEEITRAQVLLEIASDTLRQIAKGKGLDLDQMIDGGEVYESVVKDVVISGVARVLRSSTSGEVMSQVSQSALGYSVSGTFLNPQGGMFFYDNELKRLGLTKRQKFGRVEFYDPDL